MKAPSTRLALNAATPDPRCVMIVAGEASGDLHGANLVRALRREAPGLFVCGIGGDRLRAEGVRILLDASRLAVVGITEVLAKLPAVWEALRLAKKLLQSLRPDLLILIDFPDFNLRVARMAKKCGVPVLYYVSPQIWAWRRGRVQTIKQRVDHMAVILPFEAGFYQSHGVPVTFVGHPLLDVWGSAPPPPPAGLVASPVVGLLPGSREGEIQRLLPVMLQAARRLETQFGTIRFLVSVAPTVNREQVGGILQRFPGRAPIAVVAGGIEPILRGCHLVLAASGTVTLEAAIGGMPMVIVYKVSPLSYRIGKALIRVKHISLVNLIAGRELVPELIQDQANPVNIAAAAAKMLADPRQLATLRTELLKIRSLLGGGGASGRVAAIALGLLQKPGGFDPRAAARGASG
jgi:lipid-A-disaccharide synthase